MSELVVEGKTVAVSTLDRVLYPVTGFTKANLIDYYVRVGDVLLPHLRGRPLALHRYPEGVDGDHFFQSRCPPHPPWLRTATLSFSRTGKTFAAPVIDDLAGLVWAANLATIELHPFLARLPDLDRPVEVVFDLDPGPPATFPDACAVALALREMLDEVDLRAWPKVSGVKGLHLHVPLHSEVTYAETKAFAREMAARLVQRRPDLVIDRMPRELRTGKVFVDWSQNDAGKSTIAAYSLRGLPIPTVAAPVTWEEVASAAAGRSHIVIRPHEVFTRPDLMAGLDRYRQKLPGTT